jgi:G3E family GTPase
MASVNAGTRLTEKLLAQFKNSPHITAILDIIADPMQDTIDAADFILANKDIDTAEGDQLDKLAAMIGLERPPNQEANLFTLWREGEADDEENAHGFYNSTDGTGGYLPNEEGLDSVTDPGDMSDVEFRKLIKQKASAYKTRMSRLNLYNYLIASGGRCNIDDDTTFYVEIDPFTYDEISQWRKNYIITRGFKPAGIKVIFRESTRDEDSI